MEGGGWGGGGGGVGEGEMCVESKQSPTDFYLFLNFINLDFSNNNLL